MTLQLFAKVENVLLELECEINVEWMLKVDNELPNTEQKWDHYDFKIEVLYGCWQPF